VLIEDMLVVLSRTQQELVDLNKNSLKSK
jgi:hypothetical protein